MGVRRAVEMVLDAPEKYAGTGKNDFNPFLLITVRRKLWGGCPVKNNRDQVPFHFLVGGQYVNQGFAGKLDVLLIKNTQ